MTVLLDPSAAESLARICGMFGSDHNGERTAAIAKVDELARSVGLLPPREPDTIEALIDLAEPRRGGVERAWLPSQDEVSGMLVTGSFDV